MENGKVVSLNFYESIVDAKFDADILMQNGIKCKINQSVMDSIYPIPIFTDNSLEILVFEQDEQKAIEILNDYHNSKDNE